MTRENRHEDSWDPVLSAALRASVRTPPVDDVDWAALQTRVERSAQPLLARSRSWRLMQLLGRWSWPGGIMAGSAAAVLALLLGVSAALSGGEDSLNEFRTVEEELAQAAPAGARPLLVASGESAAMLDAVLFYEAEEW